MGGVADGDLTGSVGRRIRRVHSLFFLRVGGASFDEPGGASPFSLPSARVWPPAPCGQWGLSVRVPSSLCVVGPHGSSRLGGWMRIFSLFERRPNNFGVVSVAWLSSWPSA